MTLAKLESGESEHIIDETIWKSSVTGEEINVQCSSLPCSSIPVHVQRCWHGDHYNIKGRGPLLFWN